MKAKIITFISFICISFFIISCGNSNKGPSDNTLEQQFSVNLPAYFSVSSFDVKASENMGTDVEPIYKARYEATIKLGADTYDIDHGNEDVTFLKPLFQEGEKRTIYGIATATLQEGKWVIQFAMDNNPISQMGKPKDFFNARKIIIVGSKEESEFNDENKSTKDSYSNSNKSLENNTIPNDMAFEWPKNGEEFSFNGFNSSYQTHDKVLFSNDFSFEIILLNSSSNQSLDATIFSNQNDNGCYGLVFANRSDNSNGYNIFYGDGNNNWIGIDINKFAIPVNQWTHYVFVKKGDMTYLYENGLLKYEGRQLSNVANFSACNFLTFGRCPFKAIRYWKGSIKLARFWNRSLSDNEVRSLFN